MCVTRRRTRDFTMEGVHMGFSKMGQARESGGWDSSSWVQGQSPSRESGRQKKNVKFCTIFNIFQYNIYNFED